jgi:putative heme-binding domain-containing protein
VFRKNCATCHRLENTGHVVGPDLLAALKGKDKATLLVAILDPNREIDARYVNQVVTLRSGRTTTGLTAVETAGSLTLKRAEGVEEVLLRGQIDSVEATGQSLMPEGLEKEIPPASMADLLAYLIQQGG